MYGEDYTKQKEDPEYNRLSKLLNNCKRVESFEYEGRIFLGYDVDAVKAFIKDEPYPADFFVWLQKNYKELTHV